MKHAVSNDQSPIIARLFNRLPYGVVAAMIYAINRGVFSGSWFSPLVRALSRRANFLRERMNKLDRVVVPTRLMEEMLVKNGLDPARISFSRFGIRPPIVEAHEPDATGNIRIGFIGGLTAHKGAHLLISAGRRLPPDLAFELKIYGRNDLAPDYRHNLQQLAAGDSRIHFCGTFPNEQIGKIFADLDMLVVPSIWYENTPLVIYSAQAANCPVIATNLGGMAEVVEHGKNGLLFEKDDVAGLAAAIERLARDRELLHRLAANAIRPRSIGDYVADLLMIYDDVLTER
jgi:glycosyltransferase involved in cell wall biosynthesis